MLISKKINKLKNKHKVSRKNNKIGVIIYDFIWSAKKEKKIKWKLWLLQINANAVTYMWRKKERRKNRIDHKKD